MRQLTQEEINDIRNNPDQQDWNTISYEYVLSEAFIREFQDKVNWYGISRSQSLSEEFIREFLEKVDWFWVSANQKLSEELIRGSLDKVHWFWIFCYQVLSENFVREFQDRLTISDVSVIRRPVTYDEIMSYNPCMDGVERYLEHTAMEETITWNTLLERHSHKDDIRWLYSRRIQSFVS